MSFLFFTWDFFLLFAAFSADEGKSGSPGRRAGEINMFESCSADFTRVIRSLAENVAKAHWSAAMVASEG